MFNFKSSGVAGKVFKKLNRMDKKQAYTYGAIGVVCLVALLTLASMAGGGADDSLDSLNARGYDLAQMPFLTDEAENYLLASKYPDMQGNNINALYSPEDKEDRQEEDAKDSADYSAEDNSSDTSGSYDSSSHGSGYTGRGGGRRGTPTQIGSFSSSGSMASASGGNTSSTYGGSVRGDFSPFQRDSKGKEAPFKPQNAKQALTRFNTASRAAARGVNKAVDSRKALLGSQVEGGVGTDSNGVPLGDSKGVNYDEAQSADLSGLDDTMAQKAQEARDKQKAKDPNTGNEKSFWSMLGEKLLDVGVGLAQQWASNQINNITANMQAGSRAKAETISELGKDANNKKLSDADFQSKWGAIDRKGASEYTEWYSNKRGYRKSHGTDGIPMSRTEAREKFSGWSNQIESSSVYLGYKNAHRGDSTGNVVGNAVGNTPFPSSNNNANVKCPSSQKYDSKTGKCV